MADDEKALAEKRAAAKKRLEQLKKQKAAKAGKKEDSATVADKKDDKPAAEPAPAAGDDVSADNAATSPTQTSAPSLAQQSKARSASFRAPSLSGPLSPGALGLGAGAGSNPLSPTTEGETAPEIYRKHVARIEELEKENKRLIKELGDAEKRWTKAESELADVREGDAHGKKGAGGDGEVSKLKNDLAATTRQRDQLQAQLARAAGGNAARHGSSPSISMSTPPSAELEAQLASKSSTIETMELEMSRLRAQVERLSVSASTPGEQIAALEEKLARAEKAAALAQRELGDVKSNLERASERAVREGGLRASAETKTRTLEKEVGELGIAKEEAVKKLDALEKKIATLTTLHREQDGRMQALRKDKERAEKEVVDLRERLERAEAESARLRKREARDGAIDDEAVDELEDEERLRLERKVRALESENSDLRRGIWHERRKEMQVGPDDGLSPGGRFTDVDLGSGLHSPSHRKGGGGGIGDFFASGLNALAGGAVVGTTGGGHARRNSTAPGHDHDGFLDDDDDMEFDEEAFRKAREEDARKRIERVKEVKRALKNWEGWRLDLVESRRGGGEGIGEIFEV